LQALQDSLHALSQQRLSAQCPLWQSPSALQATLFGRAAVQAPPKQYGSAAVAQSRSAAQVLRHEVPAALQARPPAQAVVGVVAQAPWALQSAFGVRAVPLQLWSRQVTVASGNVHVTRDAAVQDPAQSPAPPQVPRVP
jgi:hypothetical protein